MNLQNELYRKSLHFLLILIPISFCLLGKKTFLTIFIPISVIVVALDYFRKSNEKIRNIFLKIFNSVLRDHEKDGKKLCGASWVAIGTCVNFLFFDKSIAVTGFLILVVSDALAAIIGKSYPSRPFFEKSLSGSIAFFVSGMVILIVCGEIFRQWIWFHFFGLFALFCVTIIEARPSFLKIDDNFTIPVVFSAVLTFFKWVWNGIL